MHSVIIMESRDDLKQRLSPEQFRVACECGTEPPFDNEYWDNKEPGIYVDVISGEALFSSKTKFDSGTGWPSFYEPLNAEEIVEVTDATHGMTRTEVRSDSGDAHLGHVFPDGPQPTGLRYCLNSASLRFVHANDLHHHGLERFASLFEDAEAKDASAT